MAGSTATEIGNDQAELIGSKLGSEGWPIAYLKMPAVRRLLSGRLIQCYRQLIRTIPEADVVHLFVSSLAGLVLVALPIIMLSAFFGRKIVLNLYSSTVMERIERWMGIWAKFLKQVDSLVVPSEHARRVLASKGLKATHGVPMVDIDSMEQRALNRLQPRVLVECPLESQSDIVTILRAFAVVKQKYPRSELVIAGEGRQRKALERIVTESPIYGVEFIGQAENINRLVQEADLYVYASADGDVPLSLQVAMASGLPVIAVASEPVKEIITQGYSGLLFEPGNESMLADRILQLVENDNLVGELSRRGRVEAEKFAWDNLKTSWTSRYLTLARR